MTRETSERPRRATGKMLVVRREARLRDRRVVVCDSARRQLFRRVASAPAAVTRSRAGTGRARDARRVLERAALVARRVARRRAPRAAPRRRSLVRAVRVGWVSRRRSDEAPEPSPGRVGADRGRRDVLGRAERPHPAAATRLGVRGASRSARSGRAAHRTAPTRRLELAGGGGSRRAPRGDARRARARRPRARGRRDAPRPVRAAPAHARARRRRPRRPRRRAPRPRRGGGAPLRGVPRGVHERGRGPRRAEARVRDARRARRRRRRRRASRGSAATRRQRGRRGVDRGPRARARRTGRRRGVSRRRRGSRGGLGGVGERESIPRRRRRFERLGAVDECRRPFGGRAAGHRRLRERHHKHHHRLPRSRVLPRVVRRPGRGALASGRPRARAPPRAPLVGVGDSFRVGGPRGARRRVPRGGSLGAAVDGGGAREEPRRRRRRARGRRARVGRGRARGGVGGEAPRVATRGDERR